MDYIFVTADKLQNLNKSEGDIEFKYVSSEPVNFFESSLSMKIAFDFNLKPDVKLEENSNAVLKPCLVYDMIKKIEFKFNNTTFAENTNLYDYIRFTQILQPSNRDEIYGLNSLGFTGKVNTKHEFYFNIPLKFLFAEFKGLNHVLDGQFFLKMIFNKITKNFLIENNHIINIQYEILKCDLKIPTKLRQSEIVLDDSSRLCPRKVFMNKTDVSYALRAGKADITVSSNCDKPISFVGYFTDGFNKIVKGCTSFQLMINNNLYPIHDMQNETSAEHLYEMYLRYIDYHEGYDLLESHQKPLNVLSFSDFSKEPKFFFILPKLSSKNDIYDIKVKLIFDKQNNLIQDLNYLFFYFE